MIGNEIPVQGQPHIDKKGIWPLEQLEMDPFALPVRYELPGRTMVERAFGTKWAITLYRDHLVLWQGAKFKRSQPRVIPLSDFDAVIATTGYVRGAFRIAVNLVSARHDLEIPVYIADHTDHAAARWDAWARSLGLPVRTVDAEGTLNDPLGMLGSVICGRALPRRVRGGTASRHFKPAWSSQRNMA